MRLLDSFLDVAREGFPKVFWVVAWVLLGSFVW